MPRYRLSDHEMDRRKLMAAAKCDLTKAMSSSEKLTALEWISVLYELLGRMIGHGLVEEFESEEKPCDT